MILRTRGSVERSVAAELRPATADDLAAVVACQERVLGALEDRELFEPTDAAHLGAYLAAGLGHVCTTVGGGVVAYTILLPFAETDAELQEEMVKLAVLHHLAVEQIATLDTVAVDADHRGNGLQRILCERSGAQAEAAGHRGLMASVSPRNEFSLANFAAMGYETVAARPLYGGKERLILYRPGPPTDG